MKRFWQRSMWLFILASLVGVGCAHKKITDDAQANASPDSSVMGQDLRFDATGSDSKQIPGLSSVRFAYDQSLLSLEARKIIEQNVEWLGKHRRTRLEIQGHCDRHGSTEYNLGLGERRAKAVRDYMVSLGADAKLLTTVSYGKEHPLDTGDSEAADAANRRANFVPQPIATHKLGAK